MEQLGFDSRLTKTAPFQRATGIGMCTWKFCHVKEEQQGKGGARGPTAKLEKRCVVWRWKRWSSRVRGVKTMGLDHMVWFMFFLSGMATSTQLSEAWTKLWSPLFTSRLARTKGKFVCLWTSLIRSIWDSIINVSFGCQKPLWEHSWSSMGTHRSMLLAMTMQLIWFSSTTFAFSLYHFAQFLFVQFSILLPYTKVM